MTSRATNTATWVEGAAGSGFDVDHLPYGVFARSGEHPRVAVRIGDFVLDLSIVAAADMVDTHALFDQPTLDPFWAGPGSGTPPGPGSPGCSPTRPSATSSSRRSHPSTRCGC